MNQLPQITINKKVCRHILHTAHSPLTHFAFMIFRYDGKEMK